MKINRSKTSVWLGALSLVVALALGSCSKEPLLPSEQPNKEYMDLTLELTPPGAFTPVGTRAMSDLDQNKIERAYVLVFKNNILFDRKPGVINTVNGATTTIKVALIKSQTESELFDIMVIGNPPKDFIFNDNITKDELKATLTATATEKWVDAPFEMYGEVFQKHIDASTSGFNIQMLRSLARIDIGVGAYSAGTGSTASTTGTWAGLPGVFSLDEVQVYNTRSKFAVIPEETTLNTDGKVKVDAPTIPTDAGVNSGVITYGTTDITDSKYIQSTIFLAEAPNTTDRVTLVVGGKYMGSETTTYYRIDMCVPKAGGAGYDYLNILRNHLYRITITSVSGAGFATAQEALISAPINITTELIPIAEGGSGDIIFDDNNYLQTDVSSVLIYGKPDGVKSYDMVKVKASITTGVTNSITIAGGTTPLTLENGVEQLISCVIPEGITAGDLTIRIGRLTKVIPFTVQAPVDAHFDFLPFMNVDSIKVVTTQDWLTLSHNTTYVASEQQLSQIGGNDKDKACLHFDENIDTENAPRTAQALVKRSNYSGITRVHIEQLNLKGMVVGKFGGAMNTSGYPHKLAVEAVEEFRDRLYDDTSIGQKEDGVSVGFNGTTTGVTDPDGQKKLECWWALMGLRQVLLIPSMVNRVLLYWQN